MGRKLRKKVAENAKESRTNGRIVVANEFVREMREERDTRKSMPTRRGVLWSATFRLAIE